MNRNRADRLQAAVRAIPQGQIAEAARRAGIGSEHLRKMRRGESLNPTMDKLGGLADALVMRMECRRWAELRGRPAPPAPPPLETGRAWPTYPREAIPRWTIHNLRHTAATIMRDRLGVDRDVVGMLLSHAARDVTAIYDRAERLADRRAALEAWAALLASLPRRRRPAQRLSGRM